MVLAAHGQVQVQLRAGQESFRIQPLLAANGWAALDQDAVQLPAGTPVAVYELDGEGVLLRALEEVDGH